MKLVFAFLIVFVCFFVYTLLDVRVITSTDSYYKTLLSIWPAFPFFAVTPIAIWWAYRTVYTAVGSQIWLAFLINGLTVYCANLLGNYLGSGQMPSRNQSIALLLKGIGLLVASF